MTKAKLSERERRFVEAFMGEAAGNATKAAKLAGYSAKTARQQGNRLLTKAYIRAAVETRAEKDPKVATRSERQQFWTKVYLGLDEFASVSMSDRLKASELLGKSQADFIDRHEHDFKGHPTLVLNVTGAKPS